MYLRALVVMAGLLSAQSPAGPEFEAASVKLSVRGVSGFGGRGGPGTNDPDRVTRESYPLASLILEAYDIRTDQLTGPGWLIGNFGPDAVRVDFTAKLPPGSTKEQYHLMLQKMLAQRFGLKAHREQKEMQVYDLVVAKNGPKFGTTPSSADGAGFPALGTDDRMKVVGNRARMHAPKETMEQLAAFLATQSQRTVFDKTGLKGEFDVSLFWGGNDADLDAVTLPQAVQDQLGLRLESKKALVDIIAVDSVEKAPTAN